MKQEIKWPFTEKMERHRAAEDEELERLSKLLVERTAHELSGIASSLPVVFAATSSDKRVIDLVAFFNSMDERGRVTLMRMAQVMPKNDSTKEICK